MKGWPLSETEAANTPIWPLVILPAEPVYCRPTPQEAWPCLRKPVSVDHPHGLRGAERLDHVVAHHIAQSICVPVTAPQDGLLPPGAGIASGLGAHPAGLAPLGPEPPVQEGVGGSGDAWRSQQGPHPRLGLTQRRRPELQSGFERGSGHRALLSETHQIGASACNCNARAEAARRKTRFIRMISGRIAPHGDHRARDLIHHLSSARVRSDCDAAIWSPCPLAAQLWFRGVVLERRS